MNLVYLFHLNVITGKYSVPRFQNCLKIASGFGGCNAAIVFRKM